MKQKTMRSVLRGMLLLILLSVLSLSVYARESFGCHIVDTHGQNIYGYHSEKDELWYLFVPSTEDVETLDLYVDGNVTDVSDGVLNVEEGVVTAPFARSGELKLTCAGEEVTVVVKQSDLPSLHIVLKNASLDQVHANKDGKFKNNSIFLSDPEGEHDLVVENSVELKGRGNTTWSLYEKKGYQIKFDSKTPVMGMDKAKKWVLLANASDDSMMRTQLTYQMASQMDMAFVPSFEYIELWINGDYRGTYILGEKIELGSGRLELQDPMGGLFEHDEAYYGEEDYWFYSEVLGRHFALKESVEEDDETVILEMLENFRESVDQLSEYLYSTLPGEATLEELSTMIDVDSFIQYYLINEFVLNRESFATSFYWHKDGLEDVIHLGPIWDFDTCMGNDSAENTENYGDEHVMFRHLLAIPEFYERTQQMQQEYMPLFEQMDDSIDGIYDQIAQSAEMNYLRWDVLGKPDPKEGGEDFHDTYDEAVEALRTWLAGREVNFSVPRTQFAACEVSEDCREMVIRFQAQQPYRSVKFAVWSGEGGQDDLAWYTAKKDDQGVWCAVVDLTQHNSAGIYRVSVHCDNESRASVSGRCYVKTARTPEVRIDAQVAPDCTTMELVFQDDRQTHEQITFAVWSKEGGQDDLAWYPAQENEAGEWTYTVDLTWHNTAGNYHIHAYSEENGVRTWIALHNVYVEEAVGSPRVEPEVRHAFSRDRSEMTLELINVEDEVQQVWFAVWSEEDGQDDITWHWCDEEDGVWTAQVDLIDHDSVGLYQIHAYIGSDSPEEMLTFTVVEVREPLVFHPSLRVYVDEQYMTLEMRYMPQGQQLWVPVWTEENGQDDIIWYRPWMDEYGIWWMEVPLRNHDVGTYHVHVYAGTDGPAELLDYKTAQVEQISGPRLTAEVSGKTLLLELWDAPYGQELWVPVWSEENGQDDIVWYRPQLDADGVWRCWVDLGGHGSNGLYHIHAYQGTDNPELLLDDISVEVEGVTGLTVTIQEDTGIMTLLLNAAEEFEQLWIPVWTEENGQDDIVWYEPENINGLQWRVDVDMNDHGLSGTYHIHAYCGSDGPETLVTYAMVAV